MPGAREQRRQLGVSFVVIASLVVVGFSILASTFVVHGVSGALSSGGQSQNQSASSLTTGGQGSLAAQRSLVERRRAAVVTYATSLSEFRAATTRLPGAVGINLDAAEARRRDDVLSYLVLDCIDAVDGYNLGAQGLPVTQLQSAGLPEQFAWPVDCLPGQ
jgi:hypothetical protein